MGKLLVIAENPENMGFGNAGENAGDLTIDLYGGIQRQHSTLTMLLLRN